MEDRDVEEGECRGVSSGEATTELSSDEGLDSVVAIRCSTLLPGRAVVDIVVELMQLERGKVLEDIGQV